LDRLEGRDDDAKPGVRGGRRSGGLPRDGGQRRERLRASEWMPLGAQQRLGGLNSRVERVGGDRFRREAFEEPGREDHGAARESLVDDRWPGGPGVVDDREPRDSSIRLGTARYEHELRFRANRDQL